MYKNYMKLPNICHSSEVTLHVGSDLEAKINRVEHGFMVCEI